MPRRIALLATTLLPPLLGACFLDPTCDHVCEGDVIAQCNWKCTGQGKLDLDECHREYSKENCADRLGPSGGPMTCEMVSTTEGSSPVATCVDKNAVH
jgi:hypothetical protein